MAVGLLLIAFVAWFASNNYQLFMFLARIMLVFLIAEIGLVFAISGMINRLSGATATTLFMLYSVLNSCTFLYIFFIIRHLSLPVSFLLLLECLVN